jgi:rhodanese-related sulfurtransferase
MKNKTHISIIAVLIFIISSCSNTKSPETKDNFSDVAKYLETHGDFINSQKFPNVLPLAKLMETKDEKTLIVDIRKADDYNLGHISGSIRIDYSNLIQYFEEKIDPNSFTKIVIVCYSGESATYATALLQILGYTNVYALRFGSSAFSKKFAEDKWTKNISNDYIDKITTDETPIGQTTKYPTIETDLSAYEYLRSKSKELLQTPFSTHKVSAKELFENPDKYYIISYYPVETHQKGHIPGSIQYTPKQSLNSKQLLNTLPTNKPIVTYCNNGHQSAAIAAYLHLLGYDARSLAYGASSFMQDNIVKTGKAFTENEILEIELNSTHSSGQNNTKIEIKTKKAAGGC